MSGKANNKLNEIKNNMEKEKNVSHDAKKQQSRENERFAKLIPEVPTDIALWREVITENFPELILPAEVGLSIIAQLLIGDIKNPFALVYVDVPSSGKTVVLNFFSTAKELAFTTDNFTPASFVSQAAKKKKEELAEIDMLPQIRYKTLIIRDLAPVFSKKDENVQEMLGILIRVLDGEGLETSGGIHGKRGYTGDYLFMLLSASTPIRPRIWKAMGNLGSRLFFVNIGGAEKSETALANQLKKPCREKEILCREVTENFAKTLWSKYPDGVLWDMEKDEQSLLEIIARLAKILARLRSSINVWKDSNESKKYDHTQPITEMPDRLNQLLYNLARGHAIVCGRENITKEDLSIVMRVALDSAPPNRARVFKNLIKSSGVLATNQVMDILKCSRPTALKEMEQLVILGIVEPSEDLAEASSLHFTGRPESEIALKEEFKWFLTNECHLLIHRS
ncbi:MAG: hypothetical protein IPN70_02080 [Candidatus Moraniibacteriota bacterium]|nr:MAG: hypothetical protein IPN70_02080 [Candidatus Moranbacteria bacterium]